MSPFDLLLAVAILLGDPEVPVDPRLSYLRPHVELIALEWELLDPTEPEGATLKEIQQRQRRLDGAPLAADVLRFPTGDTARSYRELTWAYKQWLETRQAGYPASGDDYRELIEEAEGIHWVWGLVVSARADNYCWTVREYLRELRDAIGECRYYSMDLPPPLPFWRFRRVE